jgi:hypothetical protein
MADRDVLVEKPMALSSDHAAEPLGTSYIVFVKRKSKKK